MGGVRPGCTFRRQGCVCWDFVEDLWPRRSRSGGVLSRSWFPILGRHRVVMGTVDRYVHSTYMGKLRLCSRRKTGTHHHGRFLFLEATGEAGVVMVCGFGVVELTRVV